jgi:hypothetical protein
MYIADWWKGEGRIIMKKLLLFLIILSSYELSYAQGPVWTDEFVDLNSRWDWNYNAGTGYKKLVTIDSMSAVEAGITARSSSSSYSDCSLHQSGSEQINSGVFEARLRCSDDNGYGQTGKGTRGWGFWNNDDPQNDVDCAWFWSASAESDASLVGLQAMVARGSTLMFQKSLPEIDMREWHTYRIELLPSGTRFFVDGINVASTAQRLQKMQLIEIWIDNYKVQVENNKAKPIGYLDLLRDQQLYIDWVKYYEEPDTVPPGPVNNLKIKEISFIEPLPITFTPVADTYVNNNTPSNNYGFEATLQAGG